MRKILIGLIFIIILVLGSGPFFAGLLFQRNYQNFISIYNSQNKQVHITITHFNRGWLTSHVSLLVEINDTHFKKIVNEEFIKRLPKIVVYQTILHGPLLYGELNHPTHLIGLASIQSKIKEYDRIVLNSYASFFGNYFNDLIISNLEIFDDPEVFLFGIQKIELEWWMNHELNHINGLINLNNIVAKSSNTYLAIPNIEIQFNQYLDANQFWLGKTYFKMRELLLNGVTQKKLAIHNVNLESLMDANHDLLNIARTLTINKIQLGNEILGPIELQVRINQLYLPAIHELIESYKDILENGEVYQGQLRQRIAMSIPKILTTQTSLHLDRFNIKTSEGEFDANGIIGWPDNNSLSMDISELISSAALTLNTRISKKLMDQVINLASTHPDFIHDVAVRDQNSLIAVQNDIEFESRRYAEFINFLVSNNDINHQTANILFQIQKDLVPLNTYNEALKELFLKKQITLIVSYMLSWQYTEILKPYQFLKVRMNQYQQIAAQQLREKLNLLVQKGYIKAINNDYIATIKVSPDSFTSNGLELK